MVEEVHLAVPPFENVGGDPANQAFCDGLMETLTSKITQLQQFHESLWVVPASEMRTLEVASPSAVRRAFGVNLVVTGSVQRIDDNFRLTLNLIDVGGGKTPRQVGSSVIDDRMTNVSVLQDEAVIRLAEMLNVELEPRVRQMLAAGGTTVSEAYKYYVQGRGYLQRYERMENIDYAIGLFERAIDQDSQYALAFAGLGVAYWRKYEVSRDARWVQPAVENCQRGVELNNQLAPVHVTLGLVYSGTGEHDAAISEYQTALALDPANTAAYGGLAAVYADLGRLEEAESTYKKAITMKPDYWGGYHALGKFYYSYGRFDEAAGQFRRVVALTPDNHSGYNNVGAMYHYQEEYALARDMYEKSLEIKPNVRSYGNLGIIYYIEGRYADAAAMCEEALEINDSNYKTWANLANAYYWMPGRRNEAIDGYRHAAELAEEIRKVNPRDARLLATLAAYYAMLGENEKALSLIGKALEIAPDKLFVIYFISYSYEHLGDREKALHWIAKAVEMGYPVEEILRDPFLRELREDERFQRLMREIREAD
jgi:tetratricopeptide (TPR) repeat protein